MLIQRVANIRDIGFINSTIIYGARKGHYAIDVDNAAMIRAMKMEIQSIINCGLLSDGRRASASVHTLGDVRIGITILCETEPGEDGYEIYAMSVSKQYQNQGYGGRILDVVLANLNVADVYARCLPESRVMKGLLESRGFGLLAVDGNYEVYTNRIFSRSDSSESLVLSR